eukprot:symbB.v1.2.019496.t1/scaffold1595.1/size109920/5
MKWGIGTALLLGLLNNVPASAVDNDVRRSSMLQLYSMETRSETQSGRLRSSTHLAHAASEPCRHLPLLQRPGCERQVDRALLNEKNWVRTEGQPEGEASFSIKLDHD